LATPVSYEDDEISCLSRLVFEIYVGQTDRCDDQNRGCSTYKVGA